MQQCSWAHNSSCTITHINRLLQGGFYPQFQQDQQLLNCAMQMSAA
jgi:hypothetical protein